MKKKPPADVAPPPPLDDPSGDEDDDEEEDEVESFAQSLRAYMDRYVHESLQRASQLPPTEAAREQEDRDEGNHAPGEDVERRPTHQTAPPEKRGDSPQDGRA
jgi:hypothetical protein